MTPPVSEPELPAMELSEQRAMPKVGGYDPREYEAEDIIHKPEPRMQPQTMRDEPVVRPEAVLAEPKARPFIPGDLDRVQTSKDVPAFAGNLPMPVQQSRVPKKGPSLFERLTGGGRRRTACPAAAVTPNVRFDLPPEISSSRQSRQPSSPSCSDRCWRGWGGGRWSGSGPSMENRLKELRAERGWSQAELAERLDVSRQSVNAIETGRYDPSLPLAFKIARLFGLPIEAIFRDQ